MPSEQLHIAAFRIVDNVLGPGCRLCIWVQGCNQECPGCMAQAWRSKEGGKIFTPEDFASLVGRFSVDGLTLSGGEPFLQSLALVHLLDLLQPQNVIVFSGYTHAELVKDRDSRELLDRCDILIDGRFDASKNSASGLRGSTNQNIIQLKADSALRAEALRDCPRKIEIIPENDGVMLVGIPESRIWESLNTMFKT